MHGLGRGRFVFGAAMLPVALVASLLTAPAGLAASDGSISGQFSAVLVPSGVDPAQLLAGRDGSLWFVTSKSQLGEIDAQGHATLTGITLPVGNSSPTVTVPGTLAGAGLEGEWAYSNVYDSTANAYNCIVTLVAPDKVVSHPTLPAAAAGHSCTGSSPDGQGNLWVSLFTGFTGCKCRVGIVARITPAGAVSLFMPVRAGARPGSMTIASNGDIWVLEGFNTESLVEYGPSGVVSQTSISGDWVGLWAGPGGNLWVSAGRFCSKSNPPFCSVVGVASSATGIVTPRTILPVVVASGFSGSNMAAAPDGTLWSDGREPGLTDRLFRVNADGSIDHSAALPVVNGAALVAAGPIAILSTNGTAWIIAQSGSSTTYVVHFVPD